MFRLLVGTEHTVTQKDGYPTGYGNRYGILKFQLIGLEFEVFWYRNTGYCLEVTGKSGLAVFKTLSQFDTGRAFLIDVNFDAYRQFQSPNNFLIVRFPRFNDVEIGGPTKKPLLESILTKRCTGIRWGILR